MRGRKGDKQPGNRQGRAGQKAPRKPKGRAARSKVRPAAFSGDQEGSPYRRGSPREVSEGMSEQGHQGKGAVRPRGTGKQEQQGGAGGAKNLSAKSLGQWRLSTWRRSLVTLCHGEEQSLGQTTSCQEKLERGGIVDVRAGDQCPFTEIQPGRKKPKKGGAVHAARDRNGPSWSSKGQSSRWAI